MAIKTLFSRWYNNAVAWIGPARYHAVITPSDTTDLPTQPRAIVALVAGNIALQDEAGTSVTYPVNAGDRLDFAATRVLATGTSVTAGNIIGWW